MCLAASEISAKALMQSFEVQKKTMDKQLQIKFVGEDRDIFSTAFQLLRKLLPSDVHQGIEGVIRYTEGTITVMQFQMKCAGEECHKSVTESLDALKADIADIQLQMKPAGEERRK